MEETTESHGKIGSLLGYPAFNPKSKGRSLKLVHFIGGREETSAATCISAA
jgi:hypothetical protein